MNDEQVAEVREELDDIITDLTVPKLGPVNPREVEQELDAQDMRPSGIFVHHVPGPWLSLGVHIDWQAPHLRLHVGHHQITFGTLYGKDETPLGHEEGDDDG